MNRLTLFDSVGQLFGIRKLMPQALVRFSEQSSIPQSAHEYHSELRLENEKIETKRSRLLYQSKKRGILENDILLGEFADQMLQKMSLQQLMRYDKIINGEHMEWDLYYYISGKKDLPKDLENCDVFQSMQDFVKKRTEKECEKAKSR